MQVRRHGGGHGVRAVAAVAVDVPPLPAVVDVLVGVRRAAPPAPPAAARLRPRARRVAVIQATTARHTSSDSTQSPHRLLVASCCSGTPYSRRMASISGCRAIEHLRELAYARPRCPRLTPIAMSNCERQVALARRNRHQLQRHTLPLREVAGNRPPDDGHVDRAVRDRIDDRAGRVLGGVERAEPDHVVHDAALAQLVHRRRVGVVVTQQVHADLELLEHLDRRAIGSTAPLLLA